MNQDKMTPADELMALAGKAAGGKWNATEAVPGHAEIGCDRRGESVNIHSPDNAAFIAAACNFVRSDAFRAMARDAGRWHKARRLISAAEIGHALRAVALGDRSTCEQSSAFTDAAIDAAAIGAGEE